MVILIVSVVMDGDTVYSSYSGHLGTGLKWPVATITDGSYIRRYFSSNVATITGWPLYLSMGTISEG